MKRHGTELGYESSDEESDTEQTLEGQRIYLEREGKKEIKKLKKK